MQMNQMNQMPMQNMANSMFNMMPMMMFQMPPQNQQQMPDKLSLIFLINDGKSSRIEIQCSYTDKMSDVIDKFWNKKGGQRDPKAKFVVNAKNISPSLTVAECGLANQHIIQVIVTASLQGGLIIYVI